MTASDSLPVQFWDVSELTANERDVCGLIKQDCYCQPFQCDDPIVLQFQSNLPVALQIISGDDDDILETIYFTEISSGVWQASFSLTDYCNQQIQFKILGFVDILTNGTFTDSIVPWGQTATGAADWVWVGNTVKNSPFASGGAENLIQTFAVKPAGLYYFSISARATLFLFGGPGTWDIITITASFYMGGISTENHIITTRNSDGAGFVSSIGSFIVANQFDEVRLSFSFTFGSPGGNYDIYINDVSIGLYDESLKSDCLSIKTSHDCTELIAYSNSNDFDGISYTTSPPPTFYIRIPAVFFEEETPKTQEIHKLSNGRLVGLRSTIEIKRLLQIGFVTKEIMRKINKILMHDTIFIDGDYWVQQDEFTAPSIKKYNLKPGQVLLTLQDSVEKNTI